MINGRLYVLNGIPFIVVDNQWVRLVYADQMQNEWFLAQVFNGAITKYKEVDTA